MNHLESAARNLALAAEDVVKRVDNRLPVDGSIDRLEVTACDVRRSLRAINLDSKLPINIVHEASNTRPKHQGNQASDLDGGKHVWLVDGDNQPAAIVPLLQAELGWPDVVVVCMDPVHRLNWGRRDIFPSSVRVIAKNVGLGKDIADIQLAVEAGRVVRERDRVVIVSRDKLLTHALADSLADVGADVTLAAILPIKSVRYPVLTLPIERVDEPSHSGGDAPVIKTPKARLLAGSLSMEDLEVSRLDHGVSILRDVFVAANAGVLLKSSVFAKLSQAGFSKEEREFLIESGEYGFEQCGTPQVPQIRFVGFVPALLDVEQQAGVQESVSGLERLPVAPSIAGSGADFPVAQEAVAPVKFDSFSM